MKNIFNIFKLYSFFKDNILYLLLVLNKFFDCNSSELRPSEFMAYNSANIPLSAYNNNDNNNNNNNLKYKQSNDLLPKNNQKNILYNNCYICDKNLIDNNNELEQENITLINLPIYLAYDKIFCSPSCRNYFLSNI